MNNILNHRITLSWAHSVWAPSYLTIIRLASAYLFLCSSLNLLVFLCLFCTYPACFISSSIALSCTPVLLHRAPVWAVFGSVSLHFILCHIAVKDPTPTEMVLHCNGNLGGPHPTFSFPIRYRWRSSSFMMLVQPKCLCESKPSPLIELVFSF